MILSGWMMFAAILSLNAQPRLISERAWADQWKQCTLLVVYPTYAVKHERIKASLEKTSSSSSAIKRAEKQMSIDLLNKDTFLIALQNSFRDYYTQGPYSFIPDTTYYRWLQHKDQPSILHPNVTTNSLSQRLVILRHGDTESQTGTGISMWQLLTADGSVPPSKFPTTFRDASLGMRFMEFFESLFRFTPKPLRLRNVQPDTDFLAKQLNKKWGNYLERWGV